LHVAAQRDFLGGSVDGWIGTEDERDLSTMVDAAVRKGLDVGESCVEEEAPGWIAGFDTAEYDKAGNLDAKSSKTRFDVCNEGRRISTEEGDIGLG
jgi:hypothetical protein